MDDVSLHGKDNQQAVEILKQTGPVVRLKAARHVSRRQSKTRLLDNSVGLKGAPQTEERAASASGAPKQGTLSIPHAMSWL